MITIADIAKFLSDIIAKMEARWRRRRQKAADGGAEESKKKKHKSEDDQKSGSNADEEEEDDVLVEPGSLSKAFVLLLLLAYMALSAVGCAFFTETWNFLDSFYFCLITMVRV